jgi:DNA modification methylase
MNNFDLFGNEIIKDELLRDKFIEPPFSVLDTKTGNWQRRKKLWTQKGIKSEVGRQENLLKFSATLLQNQSGTSIFDPALCEVLYNWFCPDNGTILDPFAGGSVRGIVANYLGYKYTGIDIREEQINSNKEQALSILSADNQPNYYIGDSNQVLDELTENRYDIVFSCPPYADLEVYSDLKEDISTMNYQDFMIAYKSIIKKSCRLLKKDSYACFVVGEVRDKKGNYIGFVPDTINAFREAGLSFYNEAILLNAVGTACMRVNGNMKNKKLVKIHQNILVFKKL